MELSIAVERLQDCHRCELWKRATQAVPGEGHRPSALMLVGEQPGDEEDRQGHPFVGPAGRLLDALIAEAGLARSDLYVTNAVKHFKWEARGKRRLHKKPSLGEIRACNVWLEREIEQVTPQALVALGATALRALGVSMTIERARGETLRHSAGAWIVASYHPSAILRAEGEHVVVLLRALVEDLQRAAALAATRSPRK